MRPPVAGSPGVIPTRLILLPCTVFIKPSLTKTSLTYFVELPMLPTFVIFGIISSPMFHCVVVSGPLKLVAVIVPAAKLPDPSLATTLLAVFVVVASTATLSAPTVI